MISLGLLLSVVLLAALAVPHCMGMCACGLARPWLACAQHASPFLWGRFMAYTAAGVLAGWGSQGLAHAAHAAWPVWQAVQAMLHMALGAMGVYMLVCGRHVLLPRFTLWRQTPRPALHPGRMQAWRAGLLWVLWPCGALYSALVLAYLGGSAWQGGVLMACFAACTTVGLAPWRRFWAVRAGPGSEAALVRLAGAVMLLGLVAMLARAQGWLPLWLQWPGLGVCL